MEPVAGLPPSTGAKTIIPGPIGFPSRVTTPETWDSWDDRWHPVTTITMRIAARQAVIATRFAILLIVRTSDNLPPSLPEHSVINGIVQYPSINTHRLNHPFCAWKARDRLDDQCCRG